MEDVIIPPPAVAAPTGNALTGDAGVVAPPVAGEAAKPVQTSAPVPPPTGAALTGDAAKVAADAKAAADKAAAAPLEVKFGDLKVNPELAGKFSATAKELGLDSAKAQKVADLYVEAQKSADAELQLALAQQDKKWVDAMKADKELGGPAFNESILNARKALKQFGTPELTKLIDAAGLSNHPELVRVFSRIGKAAGDDTIGGTNGSAAPAQDAKAVEQARLQRAYPSMFNADGTPKAAGDRTALTP